MSSLRTTMTLGRGGSWAVAALRPITMETVTIMRAARNLDRIMLLRVNAIVPCGRRKVFNGVGLLATPLSRAYSPTALHDPPLCPHLRLDLRTGAPRRAAGRGARRGPRRIPHRWLPLGRRPDGRSRPQRGGDLSGAEPRPLH